MGKMMEGAGQKRRPWKRRGPLGSLLLLICMFSPAVTLLQDIEEKQCPIGDFLTEEGICCNKCSAGLKLVEKCHAAGHRSNCTACPDGEYTDQMNYSYNCRRCRRCRKSKHELEESACKRESNTVCKCEDGYYKSKIDSETYQCLKCKQCGADEVEEMKCTKDSNTKCGCKPNYYRFRSKCEPCKDCTDVCKHLCPPSSRAPVPIAIPFNVIAGAVTVFLVLLGLVAFITYRFTKCSTKRKLLSSQTSPDPQHDCKQVLIYTEPPNNCSVDAIPESPVSDPSNLPDCVPKEIKIPELIYTVLDLVPVRQVKQLVRSLGVSDTEIEQAEADHRSCSEAHYQMLRVWAETCPRTGGGGKGKMLQWPLLLELLDKLRMMHLVLAVQELEAKYGIQ
ncbi:tumor necrosis factor receptor superfamily member 1A [Parambassis ranga]|uniref:Tumor necrosis factor receptor superfamily member 1A n=1 Tax=Parambassis ranga TaxID=210632 RepID=A0A6P7JTP7_9TELE|nr:tumor necrosis factor receptor superfamily member 1A [Parambassis ranga]